MDDREGSSFGRRHTGNGRSRGRRKRASGDGDDVLKTSEVDLLQGVAVEEIQQERLELDHRRVRFEQRGSEMEERSVARGGFGSLHKYQQEDVSVGFKRKKVPLSILQPNRMVHTLNSAIP